MVESFIIIPENGISWAYKYSIWKKANDLKIEYEISTNTFELISKVDKNSISLGKLGDAIQGLTPYDSYRGQSQEIIKNRAYHHKLKIDETCGKWLDGKHISRYSINKNEEWLQYGDWLAAPREPKFFESPRLLFREIPGQNKRIQTIFTSEKSYYGHSITPFILNNKEFDVFYILSIVNSRLISWYASQKCSNFSKKTFPKLNPKDIKELPIRIITLENQESFVQKANSMLSLNNDLQTINTKFIKYYSGQLNLEKLSKKLENWHEQSFSSFILELNKAIKAAGKPTLSKKDEIDWMEIFEDYKQQAQALKQEIDKTDKEIDKMVYELYGLSEEEIKIVEQS
jgi:hypothetical protein